jgi:hypothetical protein
MSHLNQCSGRGLMTLAVLMLNIFSVSGLPFSLSFLDQESVLEDTTGLLNRSGFLQDTTATFKKLVEDHNRPGNRVDRSKFPALEGGYYQFDGFADFTNRMAHHLCDTPGNNSMAQNSLMCFDVACLLLKGAGCSAPLWEEDFYHKGFVTIAQDGTTQPAVIEKLRTAVGVLYPAMGYELLVGKPRSQTEEQIGVSLRARRRLPSGCGSSDRELRSAFAQHIEDLSGDGFKFPTNCMVGLGLMVSSSHHFIYGEHAFICLRKGRRFVCLEKNGPKGPFVRVEFQSESDLGRYMSWDLLRDAADSKSTEYGCSVLISLNDRLIGIYRPKADP